MKKIVAEQDIRELIEANNSVCGTSDYAKYRMMAEYKTKRNGKWSHWKFLSWGVPMPFDMVVKQIGDTVFLVREDISVYGEENATRYTVTDSVNQILKVY